MGTISLTLPADGQTIDASDVNTPFNTISTVINGNLDSNNILAGGVVPNSLISGSGTTWVWQTWTPTWTNLTVGNGVASGNKYIQIGKTVFYKYTLTLGTTSSIASIPTFSLPVTATSENTRQMIGENVYSDASSGNIYQGRNLWSSTTTSSIVSFRADATYITSDFFSATVPVAYATSDIISIWGFYEAA